MHIQIDLQQVSYCTKFGVLYFCKMFLLSLQIDGREPFAIDWYMLSDVGLQLPDSPTYSKDGVFKASLKGVDYHPRYTENDHKGRITSNSCSPQAC